MTDDQEVTPMIFFILSHFGPLLFMRTSPWSQEMKTSLLGKHLEFDLADWASTPGWCQPRQPIMSPALFGPHLLVLLTVDIRFFEENRNACIGNRSCVLSTLMVTVGPLHHLARPNAENDGD